VIAMRLYFSIGIMLVAASLGATLYPGQFVDFLLFSAVFFAIAYSGVFFPFQYSHFFLTAAWFLGIWLKPVVHFAFGRLGLDSAARYLEPVGTFDGSGGAWDQVLLVASVGGLGYLAGRIILLRAVTKNKVFLGALYPPYFYVRFRGLLWAALVGLLIVIVWTNAETGLIVRGYVAKVQLPWPLGGLFAWITDIGFALAICVLAAWDRTTGVGLVRGFIFLCIEGAVLSIATNSRGIYLFHTLPALVSQGDGFLPVRYQFRQSGVLLIFWLVGAIAIPILATGVRGYMALEDHASEARASKGADGSQQPIVAPESIAPLKVTRYALQGASKLVIDRWPGLEGLMSVVSYPQRGLALFKEAALQRRTYGMVDVYTGKISGSDFTEEQAKKYHNATIAGTIAFFYYSGSWWIVFGGMALVAILMSAFEILWTRLVRDPLIVAMSGCYLALVVLQLSTGILQAATGPLAVTGFLVLVWGFTRLSSAAGMAQLSGGKPEK
jgi:hypothetical protein